MKLILTDDDDEVLGTWDMSEYDLTKPLSARDLILDIQEEIERSERTGE